MRMRDWRTAGHAVLLWLLWACSGLCAAIVVRALSPGPDGVDVSTIDIITEQGGQWPTSPNTPR